MESLGGFTLGGGEPVLFLEFTDLIGLHDTARSIPC